MALIESDLSSFGSILKEFRIRAHLTQQQLASALGVHRRTISRWESGDYLPGVKSLVLELARLLRLSHQETRQFLEASLTALAPYWSVSLPRNPFFTGREEILEALHAQLGAAQAVALTQSSALHGLGGVGKTQIALEYVYRHALEYSAVFWGGAETDEQIAVSLLNIAEVLQLPEREDKDQQRVIVAVQRWLSTHKEWLLIWDNVEDLDILRRFLPTTRSGAILLTTRRQTLGTLARGLDLAPMEHEEGILFLLRRAKVLSSEATSEQMHQLATQGPDQYAAASELVTILGGLPLALDQAGAYLEETRCGLSAYLDLFRTQRTVLLHRRGDGAYEHLASVSTTFTLAITAVAKSHPAALDLLHVCALLQPDAIPEELFLQGGKYLGVKLANITASEMAWNQLMAYACGYSLLVRQPEHQIVSLHRLVQAVLLDGMTETEQQVWKRRVIEALNAVFPEPSENTTSAIWKRCERLLPHVLLRSHQAGGTSDSLACASLDYKTAFYLYQRGQYTEAEQLFQYALQMRERALGPDHPDVAASLNRLALLFISQGKYIEAEPLFQRALQIWKRALGPDHPETVAALNNLALIHLNQGQYTEAETLFQHALQIWEQKLGAGHAKVGAALYNLGDLYLTQDKYMEAEPFFLRALRIWEQVWGPEDTDVAYALEGLANLSREIGNYESAEAFFQRALRIREKWLGSEHPGVANLLHGLGALSLKQEQIEQAEQFYQQALAIRERCHGLFHVKTAQTLHDLALLRQKQGNLSEAIPFAKRALSIRTQSLGDTHPKTITTRTLYTQLVQKHADAENTASEQEVEEIPGECSKEPLGGEPSLLLRKGADASSSVSDPLQAFLDACCELHPRAWCRSTDLWQAYERWVQEHQERYPLSRRAFLGQVKAHGCCADRTMTARIWRGIAVVQKEP
jgi:tetratricopeptide (TPR) repeat protein/transcriptional regulator with XRE-family HTH domain